MFSPQRGIDRAAGDADGVDHEPQVGTVLGVSGQVRSQRLGNRVHMGGRAHRAELDRLDAVGEHGGDVAADSGGIAQGEFLQPAVALHGVQGGHRERLDVERAAHRRIHLDARAAERVGAADQQDARPAPTALTPW